MITLAIDTCLGACGAAVLDGETVRASTVEPMWRGHQERLGSLVRETMQQSGVAFSDLDLAAATVGPGSFTGLRVGIAFAKGLAVALGIRGVGVGSLEALAATHDGSVLALADARRGQVYWQAFEGGAPVTDPAVSLIEAAVAHYGSNAPARLIGPGAHLLAAAFPAAQLLAIDAPDPIQIARIAAAHPDAPLTPLYLRPPDAKLPGGIDPFA